MVLPPSFLERPIALVSTDTLGSSVDRRAYFFLLRQEKVAKKKATPSCAVGYADSPTLLDEPGGCGTRGYAPQTVLADYSRPISVARRFTRGPKDHQSLTAMASAAIGLMGRLEGAEQRRDWWIKGEHCLRGIAPSCAAPTSPE